MAHIDGPVTIKRYAAERLYDTRAARYVTLCDLADMVEDHDFIITDAEPGNDITRSALKQIIVERKRHG